MKLYHSLKSIFLFYLAIPISAFSDVTIKSPLGTSVIFSEKKNGSNYDSDAWGALSFNGNGYVIDLGIKDRYFTEDGSTKVSPSGRYLILNSISGGYISDEGEEKEYVDKAHCSIVDMKNGCYVSDWEGDACGYDWKKNEDVLENSQGTDTFDFKSLRPTIKNVKENLASLNKLTVKRYLRCDAPDNDNINTYQELVRKNKESKSIVNEYILNYVRGITSEKEISKKSYLFLSPEDNSKTSAYLVTGDKVKVIQTSKDNNWINIGYINSKGVPLVAWIMADSLGK